MRRTSPFVSILLSLYLTLSVAAAATATTAVNGSIFTYSSSDYSGVEVVFALNVDKSTGDLFFHMSGPSGQAWLGVGVGSSMTGATVFIAYSASNHQNMTLSPRISSGENEPSYYDGLTVEMLYGSELTNANTINDETMTVDAVCRKCTAYLGSTLDLTSTAQPFIFAMGPSFPYSSDSLTAGLWQHEYYGHFTVDMTQATTPDSGSVPVGPYNATGASAATGFTVDNDPAQHIHGVIMSFIFVLLLPIGSLVLRVWNKVKAHYIIQSIGMVLFLMAFAGGCVLSTKFNRSKNFDNPHQIIGILVLIGFLTQFALGVVNHRIFKRTQKGTIMGKIHLYLGPAVILFGIINGALGFELAEIPEVLYPYIIGVVFIALVYTAIRCFAHMCFRGGRLRRKGANVEETEGYQFPQFGGGAQSENVQTSAYPYANPPPAYDANQRIPLQTYESSNSVQQLSSQPVEPRTMI